MQGMMEMRKKSANRNKVKMFAAQQLQTVVHWNIQAALHHFQPHFHIVFFSYCLLQFTSALYVIRIEVITGMFYSSKFRVKIQLLIAI
jgi:hypothetical protein